MDDHKDRARVEVLTVSDRGRRRRWATAEKVRIVEESFRPDISTSEVARHHELSRSQLYEWRHRYRHGLLGDAPIFSPLMPVAPEEGQALLSCEAGSIPSSGSEQSVLVIDMKEGPSIRVPSGFDIDAVVRLVRGLEGKGDCLPCRSEGVDRRRGDRHAPWDEHAGATGAGGLGSGLSFSI